MEKNGSRRNIYQKPLVTGRWRNGYGERSIRKGILYWLCHLPSAGALQIRLIGEEAGGFREAYYIEGTQILENQLNIYRLTKNNASGSYEEAADDQMFSIIEAIRRLQA